MNDINIPGIPTQKLPIPNELPLKKNFGNRSYVALGIFIGIIIAIAFVQLEISPQWVTDQTCNDYAALYYQQGIIDVANFTTMTGNFTYILDGSINTRGVQDYCVSMIQNLNNQEVQQNANN